MIKDTFQGIKYALPKVDSKEAGKWWYHTEREGTTVNRAEYRGGVVTFDFDGINYYLYDIQLGLANDNSISAGWHKISFKLNSSFAASVTICGTRVDWSKATTMFPSHTIKLRARILSQYSLLTRKPDLFHRVK